MVLDNCSWLEKKLATICKHAGIAGNITNHSLRATSATQLYRSGVPEKVIQERTGHRSLEALCGCMRDQIVCNTNQHAAHSWALVPAVKQAQWHKSVQQMAYQQTVTRSL